MGSRTIDLSASQNRYRKWRWIPQLYAYQMERLDLLLWRERRVRVCAVFDHNDVIDLFLFRSNAIASMSFECFVCRNVKIDFFFLFLRHPFCLFSRTIPTPNTRVRAVVYPHLAITCQNETFGDDIRVRIKTNDNDSIRKSNATTFTHTHRNDGISGDGFPIFVRMELCYRSESAGYKQYGVNGASVYVGGIDRTTNVPKQFDYSISWCCNMFTFTTCIPDRRSATTRTTSDKR